MNKEKMTFPDDLEEISNFKTSSLLEYYNNDGKIQRWAAPTIPRSSSAPAPANQDSLRSDSLHF